jgi:hypothetical protein
MSMIPRLKNPGNSGCVHRLSPAKDPSCEIETNTLYHHIASSPHRLRQHLLCPQDAEPTACADRPRRKKVAKQSGNSAVCE